MIRLVVIMHEYPPESDVESLLLKIENDVTTGEGSETIEAYETYICAKNALLETLDAAMNGEGESADEIAKYIHILLHETAEAYATILQTIDSFDSRVDFAALLMQHVTIEFADFMNNYETNISISVYDIDAATADLKECLEDFETVEDEVAFIEKAFLEAYCNYVVTLLQFAKKNKKDNLNLNKEILIYHALDLLKDATKIALGATAAVLLTQRFSKK